MKYFEKRKKAKLYRQWVEQAGLVSDAVPPEAGKAKDVSFQVDDADETVGPEDDGSLIAYIEPDSDVVTHPEVAGDMMTEISRREPRLPSRRILYILLGVAIVVFCAGLILLIVLSG